MSFAAQQIAQFAQGTRPKGQRRYGQLGDFDGTLTPSDKNDTWYYVRVETPSGFQLGEYQARGAVRKTLNMPVILEQDPLSGQWFIVGVDEVMLEAASYSGPDPHIPTHAESHNWGGDDRINYIDIRQVYNPARVQIKSGETKTVLVQQGWIPKPGSTGYRFVESTSIDLTSYYPGSGNLWVLIYIKASTATVTVGDNNAVLLEQLMQAPAGDWPLAAIRLTAGSSQLQWTDMVDLRMGGVAGADAFTDLSDTPFSYTGNAGAAVLVNEDASGLRFGAATSDLDGWQVQESGNVTVTPTNASTRGNGIQYATTTVTLADTQPDSDYRIEILAIEDSPVWPCTQSHTADDFELVLYGIAETGTLSPTVYWRLWRLTT